MTAAAHEFWPDERAKVSWLQCQLALQRDQGVIWSPVLLLAGIWCYFLLPVEPALMVFALIAMAFAGAVVLLFNLKRGKLLLAISVAVAGVLLAKAQVMRAETPVLPATTPAVSLSGIVESLEWRGPHRANLVLAVTAIDGLIDSVKPRRIRLTLNRPPRDVGPGIEISGRAYLQPLPVPVIPGGFDYGRQLYLAGIGATGRFTGDVAAAVRDVSWRYWLRSGIGHMRKAIGARILAAFPAGGGGLAEALITGERGNVPKATTESLQVSGLAHILSISGLHMSLVAGGVFWLIRAVLALSPGLSLRRPIKKWAAAAALVTGFAYMLLAGADVATQRSYIMLAIIFFAIIADRSAISMRNLALAALIILISQPSAALSASFHMSFMAVMGLAAFYEAFGDWRSKRAERVQSSRMHRIVNGLALAGFTMAATTLVAGTLSSIPAAYHFGRLSPLSLLTNMLALPVISFVVMPAATLSVAAMPLGLEGLPLWVMGRGLDAVMAISDWVAGLSVARADVALLPGFAAALMSLGMMVLCLLRGPLRHAGFLIAAAGLAVAPLRAAPDILIDPTAATVALRNAAGELVPADPKKGRFAAVKWLQAEGDGASLADASRRQGWTCSGHACQAVVGTRHIVYLREGADTGVACQEADLVIADFPLRGACRSVPLRIDRFDVWRNGAYAITFLDGGIRVATSRDAQGKRPWTIEPVARRTIATQTARGASTHSLPADAHASETQHDTK